MIFTKLETLEQFEDLNKGDVLAIEWTDKARNNRNIPLPNIMSAKVWNNRTDINEIILDVPNNVYFNYKMLIAGTSTAKEVYLIQK